MKLAVAFLVLLVAWAYKAEAQLSDDSLKKLCIAIPCPILTKNLLKGETLSATATEHLSRVFLKHKVFEVDYSIVKNGYVYGGHGPQGIYYALNINSGKIANLRSYVEFNEDINAAKKLNNLDRCYLYLLVNGIGQYLTMPRNYSGSLLNNSLFYSSDNYPYFQSVYDGLYESFTELSSNRQIYVGAIDYTGGKLPVYNMFKFTFNGKKQLTECKLVAREIIERRSIRAL